MRKIQVSRCDIAKSDKQKKTLYLQVTSGCQNDKSYTHDRLAICGSD